MHQLKGLIWKAYKVRLRSPLLTALDVLGPIVIICIYIFLKFLINLQRGPNGGLQPMVLDPLYRNVSAGYLAPQSDLRRHICTKVLYHSKLADDQPLRSSISERCGIELIIQSNRQALVDKLRSKLEARIAHQKPGQDLNKPNSTSDSCYERELGKGPIHQTGIVIANGGYEIHSTESAGSAVIFQPFIIGSPYNEYQFPSSDLNSGLILLELCLGQALLAQQQRNNNNNNNNSNSSSSSAAQNLARLRAKPFPIVTMPLAMPSLFLSFIMWPHLCNIIATIWRISDLNENGLHHYTRLAGVPASVYWLSQLLAISVHMAIQSLVLAVLLAIPVGSSLLDPISEANITIRWLLLLTFSISLNVHAMFAASLFDKTSHAMLVSSLLAVGYSLYPLTFMLQWGPYDFSNFYHVAELTLFNPTSTFQAMVMVIFGLSLQTNEPFSWQHLGMRVIGGGISDWSPGFLWILIIVQAIFWFLLTIFVDQLYHSSSPRNPCSLLFMLLNDLCCCDRLGPQQNPDLMKSRTKTAHKSTGSAKSAQPPPDPNRLCCSLRQVSVIGPTLMMARTVGDPLKMTPERLKKLRQIEPLINMARAQQFQVRSPRHQSQSRPAQSVGSRHSYSSSAASMPAAQPVLLDETLEQHIVWNKTTIKLQNVNLDFRFNQVSFVLGQTDLKELLFATLLGQRYLLAGRILLDGVAYSPATLALARQHIGYLGERDIFLNEMTIYENLQFFGGLRDSNYSLYDSETLFVLSLLHLTKRRDDFPAVLTSRSARKLALAVAGVGHTKLLLLVEPTIGLRWKPRCQVLNLLKKYKSIRSIVVDTSDIDEAVAFGDRIVLLRNGQVDLDGTPERLSRRLCCGHWLVFEPVDQASRAFTSTQNKSNLNSPQPPPPPVLAANIRLFENLTNDLLKKDKLDKLDPIRRSIYEELMKSSPQSTTQSENHKSKITSASDQQPPNDDNSKHKSKLDKLHKTIVILKVRHSPHSIGPMLTLLKMFSTHESIHGFRLVEQAFESLEDVVVLRMSKAMYPDLPPDLLLSLQHRTMTTRQQDIDQPRISVRKMSSDYQVPKVAKPIYGANVMTIIKDRVSKRHELVLQVLAILAALLFFGTSLWFLKGSIGLEVRNLDEVSEGGVLRSTTSTRILYGDFAQSMDSSLIRRFHYHRIGYYLLTKKPRRNKTDSETTDFSNWRLDKSMTGYIDLTDPANDASVILNVIYKHRVFTVCLLLVNQETDETTLIFEPYSPHALVTGLRTLIEQQMPSSNTNDTTNDGGWKVSHHRYKQDWHQIMRGHLNRRFFYGLGFGLAEGITIGVLVMAPIRHRSESRIIRVRTSYWLTMALYDMALSLLLSICYLMIIIVLEGTLSPYLLSCCLLVLLLHKLASLPIPYLVSLIAESKLNGFLFIVLLFITYAWVFSIHVKTFIEWILHGQGYVYTIAEWFIHIFPLSSLIDSLTSINHIGSIDNLCPQVPAYVATNNLVPLEGVYRRNIISKQLQKVNECLANGKTGIETNMFHQQAFGIIWDICLIMLFGVVMWIFLLFSERVFGLIARRFSSNKTSQDPLKAIIRSDSHVYKWDQEKDRLVSDYIKCMNELAYVKQMSTNCIYVRIWLKPMSDQSSIDRHYLKILEPIVNLGQPKNEIHLELKTTLQMFIRIGDEKSHHRMDKIKLIEAYTKFTKEHEDTVVKFAVTDWTRETLYKILLHGHYNTKSNSTLA